MVAADPQLASTRPARRDRAQGRAYLWPHGHRLRVAIGSRSQHQRGDRARWQGRSPRLRRSARPPRRGQSELEGERWNIKANSSCPDPGEPPGRCIRSTRKASIPSPPPNTPRGALAARRLEAAAGMSTISPRMWRPAISRDAGAFGLRLRDPERHRRQHAAATSRHLRALECAAQPAAAIRDYVGDGGGLVMVGGYLTFQASRARHAIAGPPSRTPSLSSWRGDDRRESRKVCGRPCATPTTRCRRAPAGWPALGYNRFTPKAGAAVVNVGADPLIVAGRFMAGGGRLRPIAARIGPRHPSSSGRATPSSGAKSPRGSRD